MFFLNLIQAWAAEEELLHCWQWHQGKQQEAGLRWSVRWKYKVYFYQSFPDRPVHIQRTSDSPLCDTDTQVDLENYL